MKTRSRFFDAILVFTLLTLVYSFFYSGTFLTDDEHILASRSLSLGFEGDFNNSRVLGNERVFEYSIIPDQWANQALNIEPAQAVAAGLMARTAAFLNLGRIQLMFLLNIWVTAATAALIYLTAAKLGHSRRVSLVVAALFGLGTIAMPYTRTFFRDPLAMFFLAAAWYMAIAIRQANQQEHPENRKSALLWAIFIFLFVAGVLSKNSVILALPILLLEIALHRPQKGNTPGLKRAPLKWLVPLLLFTGFVLCWLLIVPAIPVLTRFSPGYYFSVIQKFLSAPRTNFAQALLGPFISPGKSIFIFSPVLLLSLWSLIFRFRTSWSAWLYLVVLVIFQALFYDSEWAGHVNWGLRFVLPAIPLLVLASAPAVESVLKNRLRTILLGGLLVLSFLIQVLGSVVPVRQFFVERLYASPPVSESATIWNAGASILPWSLNRVWSGRAPDLALAREPLALWLLIPASIVIVTLILFSLKVNKHHWMMAVSFLLVIILNFFMVSLCRYDPVYALSRGDFKQAQDYVANRYHAGDLVLVKTYSEDIWNYWMNWGDKSIPWTSLPNVPPYVSQDSNAAITGNPEFMMDKTTLWIFKNQLSEDSRVWLIGDETTPMENYDADAVWLNLHSIDFECLKFSDQQSATRVCFFAQINQ